jgi:hypothetical protein
LLKNCVHHHIGGLVFLKSSFLSHLCGGELKVRGKGRQGFFLSHLCGGEHNS